MRFLLNNGRIRKNKNKDSSVNPQTLPIQRTFVLLSFLSTLAASLIWGVNTLFLLDAGLNNLEAFSANAFFTAGQVLFEIPTGLIADAWGRRTSYLLGAMTLMISTLVYVLLWHIKAPFWMWAIVSMFLGLGFTFFSGAIEAWLVDAMAYAQYDGNMESVFAKGQIAAGAAMLSGSIAGGVIAQMGNLGTPYILRSVLLVATFVIAFRYMKDIGFTPALPQYPLREAKQAVHQSIQYGLKVRPVRWLMFIRPFTTGVGIYAFYALQPFLLELYGDPKAYSIAGLAAALIASAEIIGGIGVPFVRRLFKKRTTILFLAICVSSLMLGLLSLFLNFYLAVLFVSIWAFASAISEPIYLAFINALIPSKQRATILSFNSLMGSGGGVIFQPLFGRSADLFGYAITYLMSSVATSFALIFVLLARREDVKEDIID
jgi:MFS family permease